MRIEHDPSPELTAASLAHVDRTGPGDGRRALVVGAGAERWVRPLAERGFSVSVQQDASALGVAEGSIDVVLALDVLEHVEWDRWTLQQVHRVLKDGGRLVLAVPNRLALASPRDLGSLAGRVLEKIWRRLRQSSTRPAREQRLRERRYDLAGLIATLESLGYVVDRWSAHAFGWLAPFARVRPRPLSRFARTTLVVCERQVSLFGLDPRRPYPDPGVHRRRFEDAHGGLVETRERWLEHHPGHRVAAQPFDAAPYRDRNVLVLAPHPDDEIIGCGGTLAKLIAARARVAVLYATDGAQTASLSHAPREVRRSVRLEEARIVGDLMGFTSLVTWKEDDGAFRRRQDLVERLASLLTQLRPALIFTPFVTDSHEGHRAMSAILAHALLAHPHAAPEARVLSYEVWCLVPPNLHCDVTDVVRLQERALLQYATAMKVEDYVHFCQDRNYYNAYTLMRRPGFAEAFLELGPREFAEMAIETERGRNAGNGAESSRRHLTPRSGGVSPDVPSVANTGGPSH